MVYLYDPRVNALVNTNNPILIMADAIIRVGAIEPDKDFWEKIKLLADYADSGNGMGNFVKAEFQKELKKERKPRKKKPKEVKPEKVIEIPKKRLSLKAKINGTRNKKHLV